MVERFWLRGLAWLRGLGRWLRYGDRRAVWWLQRRRGEALHQTTTLTRMDRYPEIFAAVGDALAGRVGVRMLSFGCATGEEVVTLRRYFADAELVGVEINPYCLRVCRRRRVDSRIHFLPSTVESIARFAPYDAIFCLAVLQRTPHAVIDQGVENIATLYPFSRFERQLLELDQVLAVGGLLVVASTQYRLQDSGIGGRYREYGTLYQDGAKLPLFAPSGERMVGVVRQPVLFVKER